MLLNYSGSSSESSGSLARRRTEAQRESAYSSCDADLLSQSDGSDEEIYVFEDASSVEGHCSSVEDPVFQPYKSARPSLLSTHSQSSLDDDPVFQPYESASAWPSSPRVVQKSSHASLYDDADEGKPSTRSQRQSFTEEEEERKSLQELQEKLAKHKRRRSRRRKPSTSSHQNCDYDQDRSNERFRLDNSVQEDFSDDAEERITSTRSQAQDVMEEESKFPQEGQEKQAKHSQPDWNATPSIRVHKSSHARLSHHSKRAKSSTRRHRRVVTEEETSRSSQEEQEEPAKQLYPDVSASSSIRLHKSSHARSSHHAKERSSSTRRHRREVMEEETTKSSQEGQEEPAKQLYPDVSASSSIRLHKSSHARLSHYAKERSSSTRRHRREVMEEETTKSSQEGQEEPAKQLYPDVSASSSIRLHKSSHARSSHHAKERKSSTRSQTSKSSQEEQEEEAKQLYPDVSASSSIRLHKSSHARSSHHAKERKSSTRSQTSKSSQEGQEEPAKQLYSDVSASSSIRRHKSSHARSSHHAKERKSSIRSQQRGVMEEDTSKSSQEGQEKQAKQLYPDVSASTSSHTSLEDDSSFDDPLFQPYESVSSSIHINKSSHVHSSHHANKEGSSHHAKKEKASTRSHRRDVTEEETSKSSQKGQEKQAKHWYPDWKATPSIRRHKSSHARSSHHAKEGKPSTRSQRREVMDEERKFLQEAQEKQTKQWHPDWSVSSSIRVAIEEERSKLLQEKQEKQAKQFSPDIGATPSIRLHKSSHARSSHHAKERKPSMRSQRRYDLEEETSKSSQEGQEKQAKHSQPDVSAMPSIRLSKSSHARTSHHAKKRKPSTRIQQRYALEKESMYLRDAQENEAKYLYPDDCDAPSIRDVMEEERIKFLFLQEGQEGQTKGLHPDWSATPSIRIHKSSHARLSHHSKRAKSSTRSQRRDATKEETSKSSQQGQEKQATHSQPDWSATPSIRRHKSLHARSSYHAKKGKPSTRSQRRDVMDEERKFLQEAQENDTKHWHLDWSASPSIRVAIEEERSKLLQEKQEKQAKQLSPDVSASPSIRLHKSSHARSSHHAKEGKPSTRSQRREVTEEESTLCQEGHENLKKDTRDTSSDSWGVFNSHQNHDRDRYRSNGSIRRRNSASADLCHYAEEMTTSTRDADERRTSLPSQRQTVMEKETPSDRRPSCSSHRSHDRDSYRSNGSVRRRNSASADLYHDAEEMKTSTRSQRRDGEK
jgi:hypothetical protein